MSKLTFALLALLAASVSYASMPTYKQWMSVCKGRSMLPTFSTDEIVFVTVIPYKDLKKGMIVARNFPHYHLIAMHRLTRKIAGHWMTQGDGNFDRDVGLMGPDDYLGVVVFHKAHGNGGNS